MVYTTDLKSVAARLVGSNPTLPTGQLAQLVEHLVYTEEVRGSSPLLPTNLGN